MQSVFTSHLLDWLLVPEALFVAGFFLLSAVILFALALEAGTYPEITKGYRRLKKLLPRLHDSYHPDITFTGRS
ncbi:Uncharacterised protein [Halioglobus japonicus]|nr:Uncharacterised protein [Halioglobus japonicus]